jgi:predicted nucleotidyltransferase
MDTLTEKIDVIKESVLKYVSAKYIFLFGSYAYGKPTEKSDIDIYIVIPDDISNTSELYGKIIGDLGDKKTFFVTIQPEICKKPLFQSILEPFRARFSNFCPKFAFLNFCNSLYYKELAYG